MQETHGAEREPQFEPTSPVVMEVREERAVVERVVFEPPRVQHHEEAEREAERQPNVETVSEAPQTTAPLSQIAHEHHEDAPAPQQAPAAFHREDAMMHQAQVAPVQERSTPREEQAALHEDAPVTREAEPVSTPEPVAHHAPQVHEKPVAEAPSPAPAPLKLEWPSDLVQIETDPHKAQSVAPQPEETQAPRTRRSRPAPVPVASEPLVQIETRRGGSGSDAGQEREPANS
jgi:hypothetical protein